MLNSIRVFHSALDHDKMTQNKWIKPHPWRLSEKILFGVIYNATKFHLEIHYKFDKKKLYEYKAIVLP